MDNADRRFQYLPCEVLERFVAIAIFSKGKSILTMDVPHIPWLSSVVSGLSKLQWEDDESPDGRKPPDVDSASDLLWLLADVLGDLPAPPAIIVPAWNGGIQAEWHVAGYDLEIESGPGGAIEHFFSGPGVEEFVGPVDGNTEQIRKHFRIMLFGPSAD